MSFQAYLDSIEAKTGKTPNELIALATERGYSADTKAATIVDWLNEDFGLGRGHAMALIHVIKHGPKISDKHVGAPVLTATNRTCSASTASRIDNPPRAARDEDLERVARVTPRRRPLAVSKRPTRASSELAESRHPHGARARVPPEEIGRTAY